MRILSCAHGGCVGPGHVKMCVNDTANNTHVVVDGWIVTYRGPAIVLTSVGLTEALPQLWEHVCRVYMYVQNT